MTPRVKVIGGGLAGCEAALQCARHGVAVELYEMRPVCSTPAHQTADFAELVCSNSLKSESEFTAPWLLKQEMRRAGSRLLACADACAVPAGHALAVDRVAFSEKVNQAIAREPLITVRREEVTRLDIIGQESEAQNTSSVTIIATGPLTSPALSAEIARLTGSDHLFFYDSISPIVEADSIDMSRVYLAARYDKGTADYINCPFTPEEYGRFYDALLAAQSVEEKDWERLNYFEGCLPIEEIARRGRDTLRFGPMKPVGLIDPRTGKMPYAVVQLRQENQRADSYNLVGFQNHLKFGEQARVLRLIPGLENARFLRYGQIHRNTYVNSPTLLTESLQLKSRLSSEHQSRLSPENQLRSFSDEQPPDQSRGLAERQLRRLSERHSQNQIFFAGQICGVEGYVESIATGLLAGTFAAALARNSAIAKNQSSAARSKIVIPPLPEARSAEALSEVEGGAEGPRCCSSGGEISDSEISPPPRGFEISPPPRSTAHGSLLHYITHADAKNFQPANITFDLLPGLPEKVRDRKLRHQMICQRALRDFESWLETLAVNWPAPVDPLVAVSS